MYCIDGNDRVIELTDLPQCDIGAPLPSLVATERQTFLIYYLQNVPPGWDGTSVRVVGPNADGERVAIISFKHCLAHMFGPPNDEAFEGHPLAKLGLHPYSVFRIENSSWVRTLERMNAVHPHHRPETMLSLSHYIFAFHDSMFECIASAYQIEVHKASIRNALGRLAMAID